VELSLSINNNPIVASTRRLFGDNVRDADPILFGNTLVNGFVVPIGYHQSKGGLSRA